MRRGTPDKTNEPAFARVLRLSKSKGAARLVLLSIANHAHKNGAGSYPKIKTIAAEANLSERWVQRMIAELVLLGELAVIDRGRQHQTNLYAINLDDGDEPSDSHVPKGEDHATLRVNTTPPYGEDHATLRVNTTPPEPSIEPLVEPRKEAASDTGGLSLSPEFREGVERSILAILALRGNRSRKTRKRYPCHITREQIAKVVADCLAVQSPRLVLEALEKFSWNDGFTSPDRFAQRMALRKWILKEMLPLFETVEGNLARLGPWQAKTLIREVRGDRDNLEYITSEELWDLHERLKEAVV